MRSLPRTILLLAAALTITITATAHAQNAELAITYDVERAKASNTACGCFWLNGATLEGSMTLYHGLGVVGNFTGETGSVPASSGSGGSSVGLTQFNYLAGPRYTFAAKKLPAHPLGFVDVLVGGAHATNGVFPATGGSTSTANSIAVQAGAGLDLIFSRGLGIRVAELDYVHTALPNNASNSQNNFRVAFGLVYKFGKKKK